MKSFTIISVWEKMFSINYYMNLGLWGARLEKRWMNEIRIWKSFMMSFFFLKRKEKTVVKISHIHMHHSNGFGDFFFFNFVSLAIFIALLNINFLPIPIYAGYMCCELATSWMRKLLYMIHNLGMHMVWYIGLGQKSLQSFSNRKYLWQIWHINSDSLHFRIHCKKKIWLCRNTENVST